MQTHAYASSRSKSQTKNQTETATAYTSRCKKQNSQQIQVSHILRQAKSDVLLIGKTDDVFEQEAERISEQLHQPQSQQNIPLQLVQNKTTSKAAITRAAVEPEDPQKLFETQSQQPGEDKTQDENEAALLTSPTDQKIQRKPNSGDNAIVQSTESGIADRINNPSGGQSVFSGIKDFVRSLLPYDFSGVKIHQDKQANSDADAVGARAFTFKNHIWLGPGESAADSRLMAHELTHVAQQGGAPYTGNSGHSQLAQDDNTAAQISQTESKIQRNFVGDAWDAGTEFVSDTVDEAIDWGADRFWDLVERVASSTFVEFLREISNKGIFTYLKEKISAAASSMFDTLSNSSGLLGTIFTVFAGFLTSAGEIVIALASGDCGPLFAALTRLKETAVAITGDAWAAITNFLTPIGDFFSNLWSNYGAPVLDWLQETAGDVWQFISDLGAQIWRWTQPVRSAMSSAWDWVKEQLGLTSGEGNGEGGLMAWIGEKAQSAWDVIKEELRPITEPIQEVINKVTDVLPLEAIFNLRETVNSWLQSASASASALDEEEGGDVAERQDNLRKELLPAILDSIVAFRERLIFAGQWVSEKIGAVISVGTNFIAVLASTPLLSHVATALQWLRESLEQVREWSVNTVQAVFSLMGEGLVYLSRFIQPILNILRQIVDTLTNLLGKLPDLLMGPLWWVLPYCIKESIKSFFIEQILGRIPLFGELVKVGEIWAKVRDTALEILARIFIDGDLLGALWLFFKSMLNLIGLPAKLVLSVIIKGATAFSDILMNPIGFIGNLLRSLKNGFFNFFSDILSHLFGGVTDWLFGQLDDAGISPPESFTFSAVLGFVFDVLGISLQSIVKKVALKLGRPELEERIMQMVEFATDAWEWISDIIRGGPAALWEQIQTKISDLWNSVLDSVVSWVNSVIITRATRWLMSLLDVSGIMPVINALIAIYNAIESFIAYIREMLEVIESMLMSIGAIAKGNITDAAIRVENTLAQSVPIVVGFLANQFGFGAIGQRIAEIIDAVREKVDSAIDWLIEKAISGGQAFVEMLNSGREALTNWWAGRHRFRDADNNEHTLFYEGTGINAEFYMQSEKQTVRSAVADNPEAARAERMREDAKRQLVNDPNNAQAKAQHDTAIEDIQSAMSAQTVDVSWPNGSDKPIPVRYFKKEEDFPTILGKQPTNNEGVDLGNLGKLKVDPSNFQNINSILTKKSDRSPARQDIKDALRALSADQDSSVIKQGDTKLAPQSAFVNNIWQLDHVLELTLGGVDSEENLWPLSAVKNNAANAVVNQSVGYFAEKGSSELIETNVNNLSGRWFKEGDNARPGIPASAAGNSASLANRSQINTVQQSPVGADSADAIHIDFFKTVSDYPNIEVINEQGNRQSFTPIQGVTLYYNNQEYVLKVNPVNFAKQPAREKSTNGRATPSAQFRNIREALGGLVENAGSINDSGSELQRTRFFYDSSWQLDHVHESRLAGSQDITNFWPLMSAKNNAANATYNQVVKYQPPGASEPITKTVGRLPEETRLIVKNVANIPASAGMHGTSHDEPVNKNDKELN